MSKVISVANQIGGVGKTVTSVNLGIGLAREGYKVLMIDADSQGSMSISLGCDEPDRLDYSLATAFVSIINGKSRKIPLPEKLMTMYKELLDVHLQCGGSMDSRIITWDHSACIMMLEKACKAEDIRNYCCHDFRHTYISNLIRKGVPLPIIESVSGDIQATILKRYSHMFVGDEQMLLDVLEDDDM